MSALDELIKEEEEETKPDQEMKSDRGLFMSLLDLLSVPGAAAYGGLLGAIEKQPSRRAGRKGAPILSNVLKRGKEAALAAYEGKPLPFGMAELSKAEGGYLDPTAGKVIDFLEQAALDPLIFTQPIKWIKGLIAAEKAIPAAAKAGSSGTRMIGSVLEKAGGKGEFLGGGYPASGMAARPKAAVREAGTEMEDLAKQLQAEIGESIKPATLEEGSSLFKSIEAPAKPLLEPPRPGKRASFVQREGRLIDREVADRLDELESLKQSLMR